MQLSGCKYICNYLVAQVFLQIFFPGKKMPGGLKYIGLLCNCTKPGVSGWLFPGLIAGL